MSTRVKPCAPGEHDRARPRDILQRTARFADRIVRLCLSLPHNVVGWEIGKQLIRAGTSVGANVEEAQAAESTADFVHKMKIARKECREAGYFLQRVANSELVPRDRLDEIMDEADQLLRILTAIIRNTRG
jgi:four helix bundle protein